MSKLIYHSILRRAPVFLLLTVLSCSPANPITVNQPDCANLTAAISTLNNDSKYTIPLWQNIILLFSDERLKEIKTSYDAVFIYLLGKHGIFTDQQELDSLWNTQPEKIITSIKWEAYKQKLKRLADTRCRDFTNN